jgi:pimeloyl-ACP methyl ester carboxylesterase
VPNADDDSAKVEQVHDSPTGWLAGGTATAASWSAPTVAGPTTPAWNRATCVVVRHIVHWSDFDRCGHFAAMEAPDLLVGDVREFFRSLR